MLSILGVILNLAIIVYLGYQAGLCISAEQMTGANITQNPMMLSFIAVVALFMAMKS